MGEETSSKFLSQAEFARRRKVSKKSVTVWKAKGLLVLNEAGQVDVEQTEWKLDERPPKYRGGVTHRPVRTVGNDQRQVTDGATFPDADAEPATVEHEPTCGEAVEFLTSSTLPLAEAMRRKENVLGLQRQLQLEIARGEWVRVEDVGLEVEREYSTIRERLLTIPGKLAPSLMGRTQAEIEVMLRSEVTEALHELHDPDSLAARVAASTALAEGSTNPQAPAAPQPH